MLASFATRPTSHDPAAAGAPCCGRQSSPDPNTSRRRPRRDSLPPVSDRLQQLAERSAERARTQPRRFRIELRAWLLLGRALPLLVPVLAGIGAVLAVLAGNPVLALGAVIATIAAAAAVVAPSHLPAGYRLERGEAPGLDTLIDEVVASTGAHGVDAIVIDEEFNAGMVAVPSRIPIARPRIVLVLGLPLLQALTTPQVRAVVTHEVAHLAGGRSGLDRRVEHARHLWDAIHHAAATPGGTGWLLARIADWYAPRLAARTGYLAVEHERYADRVDQALAGPHVAVDALLAVILRSERFDELWAEVHWWPAEQDRPPRNLYAVLVPEWVAARLDPEAARRTLRRELARPVPEGADYPAMLDRVHELGEQGDPDEVISHHVAALVAPVSLPAAAELLGQVQPRIAAMLDVRWEDGIADEWSESRRDLLAHAERARDLEAQSALRSLDDEEAAELAVRLWAAFGDERAEPACRELLGRQPSHGFARLSLARLSLRRGTAEWRSLLPEVIERGADASLRGEARALFDDGCLEQGAGPSSDTTDPGGVR